MRENIYARCHTDLAIENPTCIIRNIGLTGNRRVVFLMALPHVVAREDYGTKNDGQG